MNIFQCIIDLRGKREPFSLFNYFCWKLVIVLWTCLVMLKPIRPKSFSVGMSCKNTNHNSVRYVCRPISAAQCSHPFQEWAHSSPLHAHEILCQKPSLLVLSFNDLSVVYTLNYIKPCLQKLSSPPSFFVCKELVCHIETEFMCSNSLITQQL